MFQICTLPRSIDILFSRKPKTRVIERKKSAHPSQHVDSQWGLHRQCFMIVHILKIKDREREKDRRRYSNVRIPYVCHDYDVTCLINIFLLIVHSIPPSSYRVFAFFAFSHRVRVCVIFSITNKGAIITRKITISVVFSLFVFYFDPTSPMVLLSKKKEKKRYIYIYSRITVDVRSIKIVYEKVNIIINKDSRRIVFLNGRIRIKHCDWTFDRPRIILII